MRSFDCSLGILAAVVICSDSERKTVLHLKIELLFHQLRGKKTWSEIEKSKQHYHFTSEGKIS